MNTTYEECIRACLECMEACNTCYDACLKEENLKMLATCIRIDRECADICVDLQLKPCNPTVPLPIRFVNFVQTFVQHVETNVKSTIMNIVKNVRKYASNVQKHAVKCPLNEG